MTTPSYNLPWEHYNVAMLFISVFLLLWLFEAQDRFFKALKYRAAMLSENLVSISGLGSETNIFDNTTSDHAAALQHWRPPSAPHQVGCAQVPFTLEGAVQKASGSGQTGLQIFLRVKTAVPVMLTVLRDVDLSLLQSVIKRLPLELMIEPSIVPLSLRHARIIEFLFSSRICGGAGETVALLDESSSQEVILRALDEGRPHVYSSLASLCVLVVPGSPSDRPQTAEHGNQSSVSAAHEEKSSSARSRRKERALSDDSSVPVAPSVDFGLFVAAGQYPQWADVSSDRPMDAERGRSLSNAENSREDTVSQGTMLVAVGSVVYNTMEVFGSMQAQTDDQSVSPSERSEECVVCLTEPKEVLLIPCRHLSVCRNCFQHVDKCPVCRAAYSEYMTVQRDASKQKKVRVYEFAAAP